MFKSLLFNLKSEHFLFAFLHSMKIQIPSFLQPGDTIGIAATARWVTPEQLQPAIDLFHSWGFKTKIAANVHTQHFQLAGADELRALELQKMLDDEQIKAIIIARGGYGTVRVIDLLDFTQFLKKPKWICGYSDITILHAHLNTLGIASIHSTMPISFPDATQEALHDLQLALTGNLKSHEVDNSEIEISHSSLVQLPILGGNLSVLYSMLGSRSLAHWQAATAAGYFLFIEDVDEMHYHLDRMMMALLRADILKNARAIICGGMTQMKDNTLHYGFTNDNPWGYDAMATVKRVAEKLNIPVVSNFPAGHQNDNRAFYVGLPAVINLSKEKVTIAYQV